MPEDEAEDNMSRPRSRPRTKFRPRGQSGLEDLTSLFESDNAACRAGLIIVKLLTDEPQWTYFDGSSKLERLDTERKSVNETHLPI